MDDELYPQDEPDEKGEGTPTDKSETKDKNEDKDDSHTELVGKKLLDLDEDDEIKPGHKCTFEVVRDWGDSVEIRYLKKSKKKESDDDEKMSADDELDSIESGSMMKG